MMFCVLELEEIPDVEVDAGIKCPKDSPLCGVLKNLYQFLIG